MVFVCSVFRKINLLTAESKWKVLSVAVKNFSSSAGYSPEEIERFRKVFRTMPSYEETIDSKDIIHYVQSINLKGSMESYNRHVEFANKLLGGRVELTQAMKYIGNNHDPQLLMNEYFKTIDRNNDGYISKDEFVIAMENIRAYDPRVSHVTYDKFLKEADMNKDGRISVSECRVWFEKNLVPA